MKLLKETLIKLIRSGRTKDKALLRGDQESNRNSHGTKQGIK